MYAWLVLFIMVLTYINNLSSNMYSVDCKSDIPIAKPIT